MAAKLTIKTNGQALTTALFKQDGTTAVSVFSDQNLSSSTTVGTITADTTYWVSLNDHYILSVKQPDGTEIANSNGGRLALYLAAGSPVEVSPMPTREQLAADVGPRASTAGERTPQYATRTQVAQSLPDVAFGPSLVVPPAALLAASTAAAWYTANNATFMRFSIPAKRTYRYVNLQVGTQSGNIQVGVCRVKPTTGSTVDVTRVAHSGVIACPATGLQQVDLGFFTLEPGDYVLFLWCDNTTAQFLHGLSTGITGTRLTYNAGSLASGVPSTATTVSVTTRWVTGLSLEAGQFPIRLIGDSITANQTYFDTVNTYSQRFAVTNVGNAGETSTQIAARFTTDYVTPAPRYGAILAGANDIGSSVSASTIIANLQTMYAASVSASIPFVACTLTPRWNTAQGDPLTSAQRTAFLAVNEWIRANYTSYTNAVLCDWAFALSNDGVDESAPKTAYYTDQVHPNSTGQAVMAEVMRRAVAGWV